MASLQKDQTAKREYLIQLFQILDDHIGENGLRIICFLLGIEYDDLPGRNKPLKSISLLKYLERRRRIHELVRIGQSLRPDIPWNSLPKVAPKAPPKCLRVPSEQPPINGLNKLEIQWGNGRTEIKVVLLNGECESEEISATLAPIALLFAQIVQSLPHSQLPESTTTTTRLARSPIWTFEKP